MKRIAAFALTCAMAAPVYAQTIATVNGKNLTQKDLDQFVAVLVEQGAKDSPELREQVKQEMVNRLAVVQAAEKAGIDKTNQVQQELELARQSILVRALMADYLKKNPVTDADLTKEYNTIKAMEEGQQEYKVRHILVKDEAAAKDLLAKIKSKNDAFIILSVGFLAGPNGFPSINVPIAIAGGVVLLVAPIVGGIMNKMGLGAD